MRRLGLPDAWSTWAAAAATVFLAVAVVFASPDAGEAQVAEYLDHEAFGQELRSVVDGSDAASVSVMATSPGGRDVWMVELSLPGALDPGDRPALLVVGSLEGDHVAGSHFALEAIRHIVGSTDDEAVRTMLTDNTVYVVPRANPDGVEAMFGSVRWNRSTNGRAMDDDNDGRMDEDAPDDLNGDGMVTLMRVMDSEGPFMVHSDDARLMKRADAAAGEAGTHTVYIEGRDDDGDGFYNEDGPGGVDLNRNFQHVHPYYQRAAGPHMVSEPESRALIDFAVERRNIAAVLTYGHSDNLVMPPNARGQLGGIATSDLHVFAMESLDEIFDVGVWSSRPSNLQGGLQLRGAQPGRDNDPNSGRRPAETVDGDDVEYFERVSERYRDITGIESVGVNRPAEGAFFQYGYFQYGVPSFSTQGWAPELPEDAESGGSLDATMLAAGVSFVEWTEVDHPDLGTVEVGGFEPHMITNPPADRLPELGAAQGEFVVALAGMLPRVRIVETEVTAHGGGIFTVEAAVENTGYFPSSLSHGIVARSVDPVLVQIGVESEAIVTGDSKSSTVAQLAGSGHRARFSWVVRGSAGQNVEIRVRAEKGGLDSTTVTLR
ncbi:MAG: hypothetical protein HKO98_08600 [Gemmatimonadetes bacterium]|nr:hypothetical protein [Gemmatimonadota bacterium]